MNQSAKFGSAMRTPIVPTTRTYTGAVERRAKISLLSASPSSGANTRTVRIAAGTIGSARAVFIW